MAISIEELKAGAAEVDPEEEKRLDAELITQLEQKRAGAERAARDTFRLWKENVAFIDGMQWLRVREGGMLNVQGISRGRIRITDNRLQDHARRLHARLDQVSYSPIVIADSLDDGDKASARLAGAALKWFDRRKRVRQVRRRVNWWIVVCGQAYVEAFFDPQAGPLVDVPAKDEAGQPAMEQATDEAGQPVFDPDTQEPVMRNVMTKEPAGDVDFLERSPFAIRRDPRFQDWRKLRYVFVEETASKEEVLDRFGDMFENLEARLPAGHHQTTPWMPELAGDTQDMMGLPRAAPPVTDVVTLWRYYERPTKKYPDGRFVIYAGDMLLYKGPMPTPDRDFPVVPFTYMGRPWQLEGKSAVDSSKTLQRLYNRILSRFAEHLVRLPAGWLLVPVTAGIPKKAFTSEIGSIIRYVPGGGKPEFQFPPFQGLSWYDRFLTRLETSMEERMALPPAVRGQLPKGARAARTVELLQEAADSIQAPVLNDIAESWGVFFEKILMFMHKHFTVERIVSIVGEDKLAETHEFKGDVLPRDWQDRLSVKVEAGESLPSSKMMRIEFILTLAQRHGFFGKVGDPEYVKKLGEALDIDAGFMRSDSDYDVNIAEDENVKILKGDDSVHVREYDEHIVHMRVHLLFMKRLVVSGREDDADRVFPHLQQHQEAFAKMMVQQSPKVDDAQPGQEGAKPGQPATPGQPPVTQPGGAEPQTRAINEPVDAVLGGQQ